MFVPECILYNLISKHAHNTLFLQPSDVDQSSVLGAVHQNVKPLLACSQTGLCAG